MSASVRGRSGGRPRRGGRRVAVLGASGTAGLLGIGMVLAGAPVAGAASPLAQAQGTAVSITVGGQSPDTGSFRAVNDGSGETTSGNRTPAVSVLTGQSLLSAGTLAQDATATVKDGQGSSAACAGLAGQGATVASAGGPGSCLTGGQTLSLNAANLDLSKLSLVSGNLLDGLPQQVQDLLTTLNVPLDQVRAALLPALQAGLTQAVSQLGLDVGLDLGAVQSSCTASLGTADGNANLAGAGAYAQIGGQRVNLLNFPANPAPNTHLVTNLGSVAKTIEDAIQTQLTTALSNATLPGGVPLPAGLDATALNNALDQIGTQLKPLQDNVLDVTLNRQSRPTPDSITVTALDVNVLPAASQFGVIALDLSVGTSTCGPSARAAAATTSPTPKPKPTPKPQPRPTAVPTAVPAGLASAPHTGATGGHDWSLGLVLGGLAAMVVAGGGLTWSSLRRPR